MKYFISRSFILCLVLAGCSSKQPLKIDKNQTRAVLEHHWEAFKNNDMEAVMADYTEDSFLITPDTTFKGLDAIRDNFEQAFKAFPAKKDPLALIKTVVEKDVGYIIWQASTPSLDLRFATDTFIIRDGKIIRQTYGGISLEELK